MMLLMMMMLGIVRKLKKEQIVFRLHKQYYMVSGVLISFIFHDVIT